MNKTSILLSVVVIARNEEKRISKCLESLSFCDEIIVVDNGSTDKTVEIAEQFHARVFLCEEKSFSTLRNIGKEKATGIWILYVDADETIPQALKEEILRIIENEKGKKGISTSYFITRENYYLGKKWPMRDKMQRFFLKNNLIQWEGTLHETAVIKGTMGILDEPLIHNTHRMLEEMVEKTNEWSLFEAESRLAQNHPPVVGWRLIRVMLTGFSQSFFRQGGWRAGTVGWIESIYQGFSMFITYAKLWELQKLHENGE